MTVQTKAVLTALGSFVFTLAAIPLIIWITGSDYFHALSGSGRAAAMDSPKSDAGLLALSFLTAALSAAVFAFAFIVSRGWRHRFVYSLALTAFCAFNLGWTVHRTLEYRRASTQTPGESAYKNKVFVIYGESGQGILVPMEKQATDVPPTDNPVK
jgi:hypothetical protein